MRRFKWGRDGWVWPGHELLIGRWWEREWVWSGRRELRRKRGRTRWWVWQFVPDIRRRSVIIIKYLNRPPERWVWLQHRVGWVWSQWMLLFFDGNVWVIDVGGVGWVCLRYLLMIVIDTFDKFGWWERGFVARKQRHGFISKWRTGRRGRVHGWVCPGRLRGRSPRRRGRKIT